MAFCPGQARRLPYLVPVGQRPHTGSAVSRPGEGSEDFLRNLQVHQPHVLVFVDVENDRAGHCVENVRRSQTTFCLKQHLQRIRDVQKS